jgi:hypothetical protein
LPFTCVYCSCLGIRHLLEGAGSAWSIVVSYYDNAIKNYVSDDLVDFEAGGLFRSSNLPSILFCFHFFISFVSENLFFLSLKYPVSQGYLLL